MPSSSERRSSILGSFRTAVAKVRFMLSFSATRWILTSIVGSRTAPRRRVSFDQARPPSLLDFEGSAILPSPSPARSGKTTTTTAPPSRSASLGSSTPTTRTVSRTSSAVSSGGGSSPGGGVGEDDIDRRAELFIANFYKHIQMERQVSLQLRYLDRTPSR
uniref:DUF761 domain-containing protein n=1 Tax=Leersia perrieri TaxID=77586 RepID=A0A0D9X8G2_9ORYZ